MVEVVIGGLPGEEPVAWWGYVGAARVGEDESIEGHDAYADLVC